MKRVFDMARARDSLEFDPLPPSPYVTIGNDAITVAVGYVEKLSRLLSSIRGGRYQPSTGCWVYPITAIDEIRQNISTINDMASNARPDRSLGPPSPRRVVDEIQRPASQETQSRLHPITLEAIGEAYLVYGVGKPRNWVARITGLDDRYGFKREFVPGYKDYITANSIGSRGVTVTYMLEEMHIYEVSSPISWRSLDRYYCRQMPHGRERLTDVEVKEFFQ